MSDPSRTPEQEAPTPEQIDDWADSIRDGIYGDDRMTMTAAGVAIDALHSLKHVAFSLLADKERLDWLEANPHGAACRHAREWSVAPVNTYAHNHRGLTLRDALDAARSSSGETPHVG
jgi:hypothetical protein